VDDLSTGRAENIAHLLDHARFCFVHQDVTEGLEIPGRVDAVYHLASPASPLNYLRLPVKTLLVGSYGTRNALGPARRDDASFLLTSTSEVYGDPQVHPQPESYWGNDNPIGPRSVYDAAKRFGEALTAVYRRTHGVRTTIVRIFNTYGPWMRADDGRAVPAFFTQALAGLPPTVAGDGSQSHSLCYVDDLVEGLVSALEAGLPGPVDLGNPEEVTVRELALAVREVCASTSVLTFVPRPEDARACAVPTSRPPTGSWAGHRGPLSQRALPVPSPGSGTPLPARRRPCPRSPDPG
jgi:dTDP-glucose 4,6-dehydratase